MIYGIGIDVLEVDRIESVYKKHGERFLSHLLMPEERAQFERTARPVRFIAMRFAAKEAIVKAWAPVLLTESGYEMWESYRIPGQAGGGLFRARRQGPRRPRHRRRPCDIDRRGGLGGRGRRSHAARARMNTLVFDSVRRAPA